MNIFLSYGHDRNSEFVHRIYDDLQAAGHQVWLDEHMIRAGDEWRKKITEGVTGAKKTIGMLSRHSVRETGVCQDELGIAYAHGGPHSIVTVLLEEGNDAKPPSLVSHIQRLDMSAWSKKKEEGEQAFEAWYAPKFAELKRALEANADYTEEIKRLGELMEIDPIRQLGLFSQEMNRLLSGGFYGREWILGDLEAALDPKRQSETTRRIHCLVGGPGSGKSALSAWLATQHKVSVLGLYFCNASSSTPDILTSLAFQMAACLGDYRHLLLASLERRQGDVPLKKLPLNDLFEFLFINALGFTITGTRRPMLLVIDGLDNTDGAILEFMAQKAAALPQWLHVFMTSRPREKQVVAHLHSLTTYSLDEDERAEADATTWINDWLRSKNVGESLFLTASKALAESSEGNFLYLAKFREMVEKDESLLSRPSEYPKGLSSMYHSYLSLRNLNLAENKPLRHFLRLLAAIRIPLPLSLANGVLRAADESLPRQVVQESILSLLGSLVVEQDRAIRPFHKSFGEWLSTPEAGEFRVSALDGHFDLAKYQLERMRVDDEVSPVGGLAKLKGLLGRAMGKKSPAFSLERLDSYGLNELPYHMLMCLNQGQTYDDLVDCLGAYERADQDEVKSMEYLKELELDPEMLLGILNPVLNMDGASWLNEYLPWYMLAVRVAILCDLAHAPWALFLLSSGLTHSGKFSDASEVMELELELAGYYQGVKDPDVAGVLERLALMKMNTNPPYARALALESLAIYQKHGKHDISVPAMVLSATEQFAEPGEEIALDFDAITTNNPYNALLLHLQQAAKLAAGDRVAEALELYDKCLADCARNKELAVMRPMAEVGLAQAYLAGERYAEALSTLQKALPGLAASHGKENVTYIQAQAALARALQYNGEGREATRLFDEVIAALSKNDMLTAVFAIDILWCAAENSLALEDYDKAAKLLKASLEGMEGQRSPDPRKLLEFKNHYGVLMLRLERHAEARDIFLSQFALAEHNWGENSPKYLRMLIRTSIACAKVGESGEAAACGEQALALAEKYFTEIPEHMEVLDSCSSLYWVVADHTRALPYMELELELRERFEAPESPKLAQLLLVVGTLRQDMDKEGYIELLERAEAAFLRAFGAEHPETLASTVQLGFGCLNRKDFAKAHAVFERALALAEKVSPEQCSDLLFLLIGTLLMLGNKEQATALSPRLLNLVTEHYGTKTVGLLNYLDELIEFFLKHGTTEMLWLFGTAWFRLLLSLPGTEQGTLEGILFSLCDFIEDPSMAEELRGLYEDYLEIAPGFAEAFALYLINKGMERKPKAQVCAMLDLARALHEYTPAYLLRLAELLYQLRHGDNVEAACAHALSALAEEPLPGLEKHFDLLVKTSNKLSEGGHTACAIALYKYCPAIAEVVRGPKSPAALRVQIHYADTLMRLDEAEGALEAYLQVAEAVKKMDPQLVRDENFYQVFSKIAQIYWERDEYAPAGDYYQVAAGYGGDLRSAMIHNAAMCLEQENKAIEGVELLDAEIVRLRTAEDEDEYEVGRLLAAKGDLLERLGDWPGALKVLTEALEVSERLAGEDDSESLGLMERRADVLQRLGRYPEAEEVLRRCLELRRESLGENDPDIANSWHKLGLILEALGRTQEADECFSEALRSKTSYADMLLEADEAGEALEIYLQVAEVVKEMKPQKAQDEEVHQVFAKVANIYRAQDEYEPASEYYLLSAEYYSELRSVMIRNSALCLYSEGKVEDGLKLLEAEIAQIRAGEYRDENDLFWLLDAKGDLLDTLNDYQGALEAYTEALELHERNAGELDEFVLAAMSCRARMLHELCRYAEAEEEQRRCLALRQEHLGEDDPDTSNSWHNLGLTLEALGRMQEAEECFVEALRIRELALGPDDDRTKESREKLSALRPG